MIRPGVKAVVQARMTSQRLPGKVLLKAAGRELLAHLLDRLDKCQSLEGVVVATTKNETDEPIVALCKEMGVCCFRGSEHDVLQRVLSCAEHHSIDTIVEVTGDCPLIDYEVVDRVVELYYSENVDYVSNVLRRTFPRGLDTQVFSRAVLEDVARRTTHPLDREHVSIYIYNHPELYTLRGLEAPENLAHPEYRWTLDTPEDYEFIKEIFERLYPKNPDFTYLDIYKLLESEPELKEINGHVPQKTVTYYE